MRARYRTIWVSDTHLGTRDCQAQALLDFLDGHECEYLYLVGDIIDFWRLKRAPHWPSSTATWSAECCPRPGREPW